MRYPADQKTRAKDAIVSAAGKRLKRQGFNGIGVDGLAAAAGVTSGAFYSNFTSKEALLQEMIGRYLGSPFVDEEPGDPRENQRRLKAFLLDYISEGHGRDAENGCDAVAERGSGAPATRAQDPQEANASADRAGGHDRCRRAEAQAGVGGAHGRHDHRGPRTARPGRKLVAAALADALKTADL
jgi:AcrR family transcriptional regulator